MQCPPTELWTRMGILLITREILNQLQMKRLYGGIRTCSPLALWISLCTMLNARGGQASIWYLLERRALRSDLRLLYHQKTLCLLNTVKRVFSNREALR